MGDSKLVVEIGAKIDELKKALGDANESTNHFIHNVENLGKASLAFGLIYEGVSEVIKAYGKFEQANLSLEVSLKNQGLLVGDTKEKYLEIAEAIEKKTGIDEAQVIAGEATIQRFLGTRKVTDDLALAIANLSVVLKTDYDNAAQILGRALEGQTRGLKGARLEIDATASKTKILAQFMEQSQSVLTGYAEKANSGVGSTKGLGAALEKLAKNIGEQLAPAFTEAVKSLTDFAEKSAESKNISLFGEVVNYMSDRLKTAWKTIVAIKDALVDFAVNTMWENLKNNAKGLADSISDTFSFITESDAFKKLASVLEMLAKFIQGTGNKEIVLPESLKKFNENAIPALESNKKLAEATKVLTEEEKKAKEIKDKNLAASQALIRAGKERKEQLDDWTKDQKSSLETEILVSEKSGNVSKQLIDDKKAQLEAVKKMQTAEDEDAKIALMNIYDDKQKNIDRVNALIQDGYDDQRLKRDILSNDMLIKEREYNEKSESFETKSLKDLNKIKKDEYDAILELQKSGYEDQQNQLKKHADAMIKIENEQARKREDALLVDNINKGLDLAAQGIAAVGQGAAGAGQLISSGAGAIASIWLGPQGGQAVSQIVSVLEMGADNMTKKYTEFIQEFPKVMKNITEAIPALLSAIVDNLVSSTDALFDNILNSDFINGIISKLISIIFKLFEQFPQTFQKIIQEVPKILISVITSFPAILMKGIGDALPDLMATATNSLSDNFIPKLIQGIIDGFKEGWKNMFNQGGGADSLITGVGKALKQIGLYSDGGIVTGGVPGRDSVPAMLTPGELVVPTKYVGDVLSAMRGKMPNSPTMMMSKKQASTQVQIGFNGREATKVLTARIIEDRKMGTWALQGV